MTAAQLFSFFTRHLSLSSLVNGRRRTCAFRIVQLSGLLAVGGDALVTRLALHWASKTLHPSHHAGTDLSVPRRPAQRAPSVGGDALVGPILLHGYLKPYTLSNRLGRTRALLVVQLGGLLAVGEDALVGPIALRGYLKP